ncbi:hypothetical protein KI387_040573, partial [Taxus chinensis]
TKQGKKAQITSYFFSGASGNQYVEVAQKKVVNPISDISPYDYEMTTIPLGPTTHEGYAHLFKESSTRLLARNEEYKEKIEQLEEH